MKIGLLVEGQIDEDLLGPLLERVFDDLPNPGRGRIDTATFPFPPNGFGEIPKNLKTLIRLYEDSVERARIGCAMFLIIHDSRKTQSVQREINRILRTAPGFPAVYGLAIQETEAWVLGDIQNVNKHVFHVKPEPVLQKPPERLSDPKKILTDLFVIPSTAIEFDRWNRDCARTVAPHLRHGQVARRCPKGFGKLFKELRNFCRSTGT